MDLLIDHLPALPAAAAAVVAPPLCEQQQQPCRGGCSCRRPHAAPRRPQSWGCAAAAAAACAQQRGPHAALARRAAARHAIWCSAAAAVAGAASRMLFMQQMLAIEPSLSHMQGQQQLPALCLAWFSHRSRCLAQTPCHLCMVARSTTVGMAPPLPLLLGAALMTRGHLTCRESRSPLLLPAAPPPCIASRCGAAAGTAPGCPAAQTARS